MRRSGWILVAIGLVANPVTIAAVATADGDIRSWFVNAAIVQLDVSLLAAGLYLTGLHRRLGIQPQHLLLSTALLLALTLGEGALRLIGRFGPLVRTYPGELPSRASENFVPDPSTGWRMRRDHRFYWKIDGEADAYVADADGYRTYEDVDRRRDFARAARRVITIGDSFTFGTGVAYEETFPALIESSAAGVAVKNMAMPGFGLDQMWTTLDTAALPLAPDLVIVAFIDEDLDRSLTAYRVNEGMNKPTFTVRDAVLRPLGADDKPSALRRWIEDGSWLLSAVRYALRGIADVVSIGDWWTVNDALFHAMQERAAAVAVPLVFVRLPLRRPHTMPALAREMDRMHASYLDLSSAPADQTIHFAHDDHIDARGHRWVAERLLALPAVRAAVGLAAEVSPTP